MSSNPVFKQGNTAVITGGASGIGLALASKLAGYGMNVVIIDNNSSNLSSAKSSIKGKVETIELDVSKVEEFEKVKVWSKSHSTCSGIILHPGKCSKPSLSPNDLGEN